MQFQYPLTLNFKILAFGPQIFVRDSSGAELFYVHQKALKLKEAVNVYRDSSKSSVLFQMKADRVIDFSAEYHITDAQGMKLGSVKREGMRSLFKASYLLFDANGTQTHRITEHDPWVRVADMVLESIPFLGILGGFFFHPKYDLFPAGAETGMLMQLEKTAALFESNFTLHNPGMVSDPALENRLLLSLLMMILLERARG